MGVIDLKRYLVGLFAVFLLFSLVACSSESTNTSKSEDKSSEEGEAEAKAKAKEEAEAQAATAATSSGGSESFANCTELKKKYPDGVASDHPAYQSKMDRDNDNYACGNNDKSVESKKKNTTVNNNDESEESKKEILTVNSNEDLAALLAVKDTSDPIVGEFAKKYAGRTIEFDGNIVNMMQHEDYKTRYDILIFAGDYSETTFSGPNFKFEDVSVLELNLTGSEIPENIGLGQNLHITAVVEEYNETSDLFFLKPISTEIR